MSFTWPLALLFVLAIPLILGVYLLTMRRRRRQAVTYSSLALLRIALPRRSRWQRYLPIGLLVGSLGLLAVASARPQLTSDVSIGRTSIILALDVSRSMCSTDVQPNRLNVAQKAARDFVDSQPAGTRTGLVVFSGFAQLAVAPTTDRKELKNAINNLATSRGTAIGAAILKALDAISEVNPQVQPVGNAQSSGAAAPGDVGQPATSGGTAEGGGAPDARTKPGTGGYVPDIIVLLTDGANTQGIAPLDAVPYAVARRVRVYTIGFGTTQPSSLVCTPQQLGGDTGQGGFGLGGGGGFGGGGGGFGGGFGGRSPLTADLPTLQQVAQRTGAVGYTAKDAPQLSKVFANLPKDVTVQKQRHEVTSTFAAFGALLALLTIAASIRWSPYP